VTTDGSQATVFLSLLGGLNPAQSEEEETERKEKMKATLAGLNSASGFIRRHLAKVLTVKHIPTLIFKEDKGLANATRVYELLRQVKSDSSGTE
jgi:ribosome-binding factor A